MKIIAAIFLLLCNTGLSQTFLYNYSFGKFKNASSFHLNSAGFIYVTDSGSDVLFKYDTLGTYLNEVGGYGWTEEAFDDPVDVFATTLNVFVCDKNNHRIQSFDKDLNFISILSTRDSDNYEMEFGYPLSCAVSNMGDLFILDSENKRILKFDLFGNFIQNFGGIDAGSFVLNKPVDLAVSSSANTFVIDGSDIVVYDNYGNGLAKIETGLKLKSINIISSLLTTNTEDEIYFADLKASEFNLKKINLSELSHQPKFVSSLMNKNKLYILTDNEIMVFTSVPQN